MQTSEVTELLNDLVRINNDRVEGYQKAIENAKDIDSDLKAIFLKYIGDSNANNAELSGKIKELNPGAEVEDGTTISGKAYRMWMDMKATFAGHDRKAVLESCEFGEDAAQRVYKDVLAMDGLPVDISTLVSAQKATLRQAHDHIKALRDREKAVS